MAMRITIFSGQAPSCIAVDRDPLQRQIRKRIKWKIASAKLTLYTADICKQASFVIPLGQSINLLKIEKT